MIDNRSLGLPIALLVGLWGAVNTTLVFFNVINDTRDRIFLKLRCVEDCPFDPLGPVELYFSNLLPLHIGVVAFLGVIFVTIRNIPVYMRVPTEEEKEHVTRACRHILLIPAVGVIGFTLGAIFDFFVILSNA